MYRLSRGSAAIAAIQALGRHAQGRTRSLPRRSTWSWARHPVQRTRACLAISLLSPALAVTLHVLVLCSSNEMHAGTPEGCNSLTYPDPDHSLLPTLSPICVLRCAAPLMRLQMRSLLAISAPVAAKAFLGGDLLPANTAERFPCSREILASLAKLAGQDLISLTFVEFAQHQLLVQCLGCRQERHAPVYSQHQVSAAETWGPWGASRAMPLSNIVN